MKKLARFLDRHGKYLIYWVSLLMIGIACSAIYWPAGLLVVGGLLWLDLFVTDLIVTLKFDLQGRREDVRSR